MTRKGNKSINYQDTSYCKIKEDINLRVAKIVCQGLQPISSKLVLIPKYMVMSWTACALLLVAIGEKSKASSALQQSDLHKEM
jgi:hypothetical protein